MTTPSSDPIEQLEGKERKKPLASVGRIVFYHHLQADRDYSLTNGASYCPAIIVRVWPDEVVNLRLFVDGMLSTTWRTSVHEGTEPGQYSWPPRT